MQSKQIQQIIQESKENIQKSILKDNLVMFFTRVIEDLKNDSSRNLFGRAYELYYLINPYKALHSREQILKFFRGTIEDGEGLQLTDEEKSYLKIFFENINDDYTFRNPKVMAGRFNGILNKLCESYFPNSSQIIEPLILGRLLCSVSGAEKLSRLPSSTIQLLGAEKALFRHLTKGNKSPKYGLIYYSKFVQKSKEKGKTARELANKLFISIKLDYFRELAR